MFILTLLFTIYTASAGDICAERFSDLSASPRLETIRPLFGAEKRIAMVNGTKGTYVVIDALAENFTISLFTSGLFDLYPIRKDGEVRFCDDGANLRMMALGRADVFRIVNGGMVMAGGGERMSFARGEMPELLKKLHKVDFRGLASEK